MVGRDAEEIGQHQRKGEEDRVVEERLRRHQHQTDQRALAIGVNKVCATSGSGVWLRIRNLIFGSTCCACVRPVTDVSIPSTMACA